MGMVPALAAEVGDVMQVFTVGSFALGRPQLQTACHEHLRIQFVTH
jgi:hypothetical protein